MALLRRGSRGPEVTELQQQLNGAGRTQQPTLGVDGIFGSKTEARVREFQRTASLKVDGLVGPNTWKALGRSPGGGGGGGRGGGGGGRPPGGKTADLVKEIVDGVELAHRTWKSACHFTGIKINGGTATGAPGCLKGPELKGLILSGVLAKFSGDDAKIAKAAAQGISEIFKDWQRAVVIRGLSWYPTFTVVAGPVAAPTANAPTMLSASCDKTITREKDVRRYIDLALPGGLAAAGPKVEAIAKDVAEYFTMWLLTAEIRNVVGQGPVPSFTASPPVAGPVVGGTTLPGVGHVT